MPTRRPVPRSTPLQSRRASMSATADLAAAVRTRTPYPLLRTRLVLVRDVLGTRFLAARPRKGRLRDLKRTRFGLALCATLPPASKRNVHPSMHLETPIPRRPVQISFSSTPSHQPHSV